MTVEETSSVLSVLKAAYPQYYSRMSQRDAFATLDLWSEMFRADSVEIVKMALYYLIEQHSGFPPDIADVKSKIRELTAVSTNEPTDEEMWGLLRNAVSNGLYGYAEEYEKLPKPVQRYLGSPSVLRELAMMDTEIFNSVTHGQFMKQIGAMRERQRFADELPEHIKTAIASIYKPLDRALIDSKKEG